MMISMLLTWKLLNFFTYYSKQIYMFLGESTVYVNIILLIFTCVCSQVIYTQSNTRKQEHYVVMGF